MDSLLSATESFGPDHLSNAGQKTFMSRRPFALNGLGVEHRGRLAFERLLPQLTNLNASPTMHVRVEPALVPRIVPFVLLSVPHGSQ